MSLVFFLVRNSRWLIALALAASIVSGLCSAVLVALINQALSANHERLAELGWRFAGFSLLALATRTLSQTLFMALGQSAKAQLRMYISDKVASAPYRHLEQQGSAKGMSVLTEDLDKIVLLFINLPNLAMHGAVVIGCLSYLGWLSWQILMFAIVTILLGSLGFHLANGRALRHLRASRLREDDLLKQFRALFDGAKELKLHRRRKKVFLDEILAPNTEAIRVQRTRGYVLYAAATSWGGFIFFAFIGSVLFILSRYVVIDAAVMSGYAMIFLYMILPIESILSSVPTISTARIAIERIKDLSGALPAESGGIEKNPGQFSSLRLRQITHRYYREKENDVFSLGPIDLEFRPGELVFLIGGNGSGKTTLAKLIAGLYTPDTGYVEVDGIRVDDSERENYRQLFSVVFSDFYLFDSLIGLLGEGIDEQAQQLLDDLHLSHKVSIKNGKFSTTELSQGQRKRLALLVAYLEDRPFYIFDEWAADQDPTYKDVFYRQLLPALKKKGKAILVISHDDRYFDVADRCVKLDYGKIC